MAYADVTVPEQHRRRGVGSALLAEVEARARAAGRTYVLVEVVSEVGVVGPGSCSRRRRATRSPTARASRSSTSAPTPTGRPWSRRWPRGSATIGSSSGGPSRRTRTRRPSATRSTCSSGWCPWATSRWRTPRSLPSVCAATRRGPMRSADAGSPLRRSPPTARWRVTATSSSRPTSVRFAQIGITMVLPEHRGHALGLALKLATHAALTALVPECGLVVTDNADANASMNAVNEQMGYRLVEQQLEVQKSAVTIEIRTVDVHDEAAAPRVVGDGPGRGGRPRVRRLPGVGALPSGPGRGEPRARPHAAGGVRRDARWSASAVVQAARCSTTPTSPIVDVGVPPAHRGRGVGSALLARVGGAGARRRPHALDRGRVHAAGRHERRSAGSPPPTATRWPTPRASRSSTCATTPTGRPLDERGGAADRRLPHRRVGDLHAGGASSPTWPAP